MAHARAELSEPCLFRTQAMVCMDLDMDLDLHFKVMGSMSIK